MYTFTTEALVRDHIRETRQQVASARRASAARKAAHALRRINRVARGA